MPIFLKKIEIFGFKSFADRSKIEFHSPITGIIGPNGSGKSNIIDAVRWVLGENSIKTLRCGTFEDIIFSGSQYRNSLSVAEVSLLFDNSSRILQIPLDEIEITKRYYRSGESKTLINKQEARVKDIINLFIGTGFSKEGYSIIGQGEVDNLITGNPQDRRNYIDELLGISKTKFKKKEAEKRLQEINNKLLSLTVKFESIEKEYIRLKNDVKKLQEYKEIYKEIESLEKLLTAITLKKYKNEISKLLEKKETISKVINRKVEEINNLSKKLQHLDTSIQNESTILHQKREELNTIEKTLKTKEIEKKSLESKIELSKKTVEIHLLSIEKELKRKEDLTKEKFNLHTTIQTLQSEHSKLNESLQTLRNQLKNLEEEKNTLQSEKTKILSSIEKLKHTKEKIENIKLKLTLNQSQKEILTKTKNETIHLLEDTEKSLKEIKNQKTTIEEKLKKLKEEKEINKEKIKELSLNVRNLENELTELESKVSKLLTESERMFKEFSENVTKSSLKIGEFIKKTHTTSREIINLCNKILEDTKKEKLKETINEIKNLSKSLNDDIENLPFLVNITEFISKKLEIDEKIQSMRKNLNVISLKISEEKEKLSQLKEQNKEIELTILTKEEELTMYTKQEENKIREMEKNQKKVETLEKELEQINNSTLEIESELKEIVKEYGINDLNGKEIEQLLEEIELKENTFLNEIEEKLRNKGKLISNIQSEITQLEKQTIVTNLNIESSKQRILKLQEEIEKIEKFLSVKKEEILLEEKNINKTQEIIENLSKEIQELTSKKDELLKIVSEKSFLLKDLNQTYRNVVNQKEDLSQRLSISEKELFSVEEKLAIIKNNIENINQKLIENYNITVDQLEKEFTEIKTSVPIEETSQHLQNLKEKIKKLGHINENAKEEYEEIEKDYINLKTNLEDIIQSKQKIEEMIRNINKEIEKTVNESLSVISKTITEVFKEIFNGGNVNIEIENGDPIEGEIELIVNIPGKKIRNLSLLSGGEKALISIIFIFSALMINNTPIVIMDEVDAPLDEENTERFKKLILAFKDKTQFIIVSHNKSTIEICQDIYGITMEEKGVSKVVSYKLQESVL